MKCPTCTNGVREVTVVRRHLATKVLELIHEASVYADFHLPGGKLSVVRRFPIAKKSEDGAWGRCCECKSAVSFGEVR